MEPRFETFPHEGVLVLDEGVSPNDPAPTEYGWRLVDGNGEIIAGGEGYTRRADAERGVRNVITTVVDVLVLHDAIVAQDFVPDHVGIVEAED